MKQNYYYLASSLEDISWGQAEPEMPLEELVANCKAHLPPDDSKVVDMLFILNDIKNALTFTKDSEVFHSPAYYSKEEFRQLIGTSSYLPFLNDYFDNKKKNRRLQPDLVEADELVYLFYQYTSELPERFLREYYLFELELRNITIAIAHRNSKLPFKNRLIPMGRAYEQLLTGNLPDFGLSKEFPFIEQLLKVYAGKDMSAQEEVLAGIRWEMLDDLVGSDFFSIDYILSYILKYQAVKRWYSLNKEQGQEVFNKILETVKRSVRFQIEFSKAGDKM